MRRFWNRGRDEPSAGRHQGAIAASRIASPRPTQRVLAIAWHHQAHALSCEAAALKMALSYQGINVDELTLIRYMGTDARSAGFDAKGRLVKWGDPNRAYLGDPDGRIGITGYGVYNVPVANAAVIAGAGC